MSTPAERLKLARERAGFALPVDAANAMAGINRSTYVQHENGTRGFPKEKAVQYARKFKVPLEWLLTGRGRPDALEPEMLITGYVGAGASIMRFEDGTVEDSRPLNLNVQSALAARVVGDSMPPFRDGWLMIYQAEHQGISEDCIGKLSIVGLPDNTTLVKILHRGTKKGLWDLESWNAPLRRDVKVAWASRIIDIRPT